GLVARAGSNAPGTVGDVRFAGFSSPVIDASGRVSFHAAPLVGADASSGNNSGIWTDASGTLSLFIRAGDHAPSTPAGVNFSSFTSPVFSTASRTAFRAVITGTGVDLNNNRGIWAQRDAGLGLVARAGDFAPNTGAGVNFSDMLSPTINGAGKTAFYA